MRFGHTQSHEAHTGLHSNPLATKHSCLRHLHASQAKAHTSEIILYISSHMRHIQVYHPNYIKHLLYAHTCFTGKTHESYDCGENKYMRHTHVITQSQQIFSFVDTCMCHRQKQTRIIFSGINNHTRHIQVYHPNHIKHLLRAQAPSTGKTHESCYFRYTQSHEAHTGLSVKPHQTLVLGTDMFQRQKQRRIIFLQYKQAHEAHTGLSPKPHKTLVASTGTIHRQNTRVMLF